MIPTYIKTAVVGAGVCGFLVCMTSIAAEENAISLPAINTVGFTPRLGFQVNEKPFFPILLYGAPLNPETLAELRTFGFNVLTCSPSASESLPAQGFYGAIHGRKNTEGIAGVIFAMGTDSPALYFKTNLLQQVAEANAKVIAVIPNRPLMNAIGYWEDEPAGVVAGKLPSKEKYEELVNALDVSAPYLYPVPYQPVASVGEAVARARDATQGKKALLPILQIFAWTAQDRYPTPVELRCMAFLALLEGAHGIGFYSYGHVTGHPKMTIADAQPELWKSIRALNREVASIGPRLISGTPITTASLEPANSAVKFRAVIDPQGMLALYINPTPQKQIAHLTTSRTYSSFPNAVELAPFAVKVFTNEHPKAKP